MSNYIKTLQDNNEALKLGVALARAECAEIRAHLLCTKFQGTDPDGARRDWIATGDVLRRIAEIDRILGLVE